MLSHVALGNYKMVRCRCRCWVKVKVRESRRVTRDLWKGIREALRRGPLARIRLA